MALTTSAGSAVTTLNGLFKDRYSNAVQDLVPDHVKLYNAVKFDSSKKVGKNYNEPVILSLESGFTYGGDGSLFNLNDVKEFKMENAEIAARELVLRSAISIGALSRSGSSEQAIQKSMDLMVGNMLKSVYHRLEVQMFYGQSNIGEVKTLNQVTGATKVIELTDASWAAGLWNGTTGAEIEIFDSALSGKSIAADIKIDGYSLANKTVTISKLTGTFATTADDVAVGDVIYFKGAAEASAVKNEFKGIHAIASETTSLFGITNTNEPLFQGSIVDVGTDATTNAAFISFEKIEEGIASMVEKGLMEEEVACYVNPKQWNDLLTEQDAKRVHDNSYSPSKSEAGSRDITFHGQNGTVKIKPSTFVKQGFAYLVVEKDLKRIGSSEVSFKRPDGQDYLELLEGKNGIEMRCYTDQALFTARPASICILRYIKSE
jgi:hypothetical protein